MSMKVRWISTIANRRDLTLLGVFSSFVRVYIQFRKARRRWLLEDEVMFSLLCPAPAIRLTLSECVSPMDLVRFGLFSVDLLGLVFVHLRPCI